MKSNLHLERFPPAEIGLGTARSGEVRMVRRMNGRTTDGQTVVWTANVKTMIPCHCRMEEYKTTIDVE